MYGIFLLGCVFLASLSHVDCFGRRVMRRKLSPDELENFFGGILKGKLPSHPSTSRPMNTRIRNVVRQTTVTKACGRAGDGTGDPFGLARQFNGSTTRTFNFGGQQFKKQGNKLVRIVGGQDTTTTTACWQVYIAADAPSGALQSCGGIIIGSQTILTAAHCLVDSNTRLTLPASTITVIVGALNSDAPATNAADPTGCAQSFSVSLVILRPDYNDPTNDKDLALLILSTPIPIDQKPCACLLCLRAREPAIGETCAVSGFGFELGNFSTPRLPIPLKWVAQKIVTQNNFNVCPVFQDNAGTLTDVTDFLCSSSNLAGQDACLGDDGGPLTCYDPSTTSYYAAGVYSFGSETCGTGLGDQSARTLPYFQWIADSAGGDVSIPGIIAATTPATTTTTTLPTTASTTTVATTVGVTATTVPGVTTTGGTATGRNCGVIKNGAVDPFGIQAQFRGKGQREVVNGRLLRQKSRRPSLSSRIVGGNDTAPSLVCWQEKRRPRANAHGITLVLGATITYSVPV